MADSMRFQYAVYLTKPSPRNRDPLSTLRDVLKKRMDVTLVEEIPPQPQTMLIHAHIERDVKRNYAPPSLKSLRYSGYGLTDTQARELQESDRALILDFGHPKKFVWSGLRAANAILDDLIQATGGFAWDDETREIFSSEEWHKRRVASWQTDIPEVSNEMVVHIYDNGRAVREVTLGMSKMGLPDLTINASGWSSGNQLGTIINVFSQVLAEGKPIRENGDVRLDLRDVKNSVVRDSQIKSVKGNGTGVVCLSLSTAIREEGDAENRIIRIGFDKYPGPDESAKQESMITSFLGSSDSVSKIEHNDELLAASAKAKAKLPELQKSFASGLQPGEFIDVKAPFKTENGGNEWMWIEVTKWTNGTIEGVLENDPEQIPNLHAGERVSVRQEDIFDYIHHFADKSTEGNTTSEVIRKMTQSEGGPDPIEVTVPVPNCKGE